MSEQESIGDDPETEPSVQDAHLADVKDGCGCTEVWEHLSDRRAADD